jgi:transposase, IS5 family
MKLPKRYIEPGERGIFDAHVRLDQVSAMGDPLAALETVMDWSIFSAVLDTLERPEAKGPGGRPSYPPLLMFKVLVIQSLYGLSDEQTQYQILDRRSFHRFLGLIEADRVPDQNTIRLFREKLTAQGIFEKLFNGFNRRLLEKGFITRRGQIIDASFVEVPRQRNTRDENESIKKGEMPEGWEEDRKRLSHKDLDAKWVKKNHDTYYGYKDHVAVDLESKLIIRGEVTDASVHDSQMLDALTREGDPATWVDSGYAGKPCEDIFTRKNIESKTCEKGARNRPLTNRQRRSNRVKARKRARVEHVFAFMTGSMCAMYRRCIGLARNRGSILLGNLVYNMSRVEQIVRLSLFERRTPSLT